MQAVPILFHSKTSAQYRSTISIFAYNWSFGEVLHENDTDGQVSQRAVNLRRDSQQAGSIDRLSR